MRVINTDCIHKTMPFFYRNMILTHSIINVMKSVKKTKALLIKCHAKHSQCDKQCSFNNKKIVP